MASKQFYFTIRTKSHNLWESITSHPFVQGIGDGTLSRERYEFFLKQDYLYLIEFSRFIALATARADQLADMAYLSRLLKVTLETEMEIHRSTCKNYGISPQELEATRPALITTAYANMLLRTAHEGSFGDILAALLPCACGYVEIGKLLKARGLPEDQFYRDWINAYASEEFEEFAIWLIDRVNAMAEESGEKDKERWFDIYERSARFEYLFFDMCWKMEVWPEVAATMDQPSGKTSDR